MQISFAAPAPAIEAGSWVVAASEGRALTPAAIKADKASGGALTRALKFARFTGKSGEMLEVLAPERLGASRILLVGLGKPASLDLKGLEVIGAQILARLESAGEKSATLEIEVPKSAKLKSGDAAAHLAFGARLRSYSFEKYRTRNLDEYKRHLETLRLATSDAAAARKAWQGLDAVANGVLFARDLVNEPPNVLYPAEFARRAKALAKLGLKVEVLGEAEMKKQGFGALLGVGQGSERESQLVVMQWNGARKKGEPVAFVGKGVCFDSGGLSLKPGSGMMGMKGDMGGAAAVTGAMMALAARKAKVNAVGVIGLVENMPDGGAIRPDDVLTSLSGQTIEVLNTDAEGRLVLADGLHYAKTLGCTHLINAATLTGACVVALGNLNAGLFSNDDDTCEKFQSAMRSSGEKFWRLPCTDDYREQIKSQIADIRNTGGTRWGGAITAAMFLKEFVGETPWVHLDIAGAAWNEDAKPWLAKGPSGIGVRSIIEWVRSYSA